MKVKMQERDPLTGQSKGYYTQVNAKAWRPLFKKKVVEQPLYVNIIG